MNECVVITDMQRNITFVNPAFTRTYGYSDEEIVGKNISVLRPANDPGEALESIQLATIGGGWEGELMNVKKNGDVFPVYLTTSIVRSRSGEPIAMVGTWRDISDRKRALESLRRWGQIFENADFGIAIVSSDGEILELMNPRFVEMHGYSRREYTGKTIRDMFGDEERADLLKHMAHAREKGHHTFESKHIRKDGGVFPVLVDVTAVKNTDDQVLYHILSVQDISERKRMEAQAKEAYRKEVLLKEIHHRVKNNLQTVASMLSLQSEHIKDKKKLSVFTESQNRIRAITLIHEKLYQSSDLSKVGMDEYFESLVDNLVRAYSRRPSKITTLIDAEENYLGIDTAIPCGLIVSELVSNCLKHAFPKGKKGEIRINLRQKSDRQFSLQVWDNGIGFPQGLDFRHTGSLGLQLVDMFIQQLNGTIEMNNHHGTEYTITFKEVIYEERG
jgi:PAS domain S-box-containing protein